MYYYSTGGLRQFNKGQTLTIKQLASFHLSVRRRGEFQETQEMGAHHSSKQLSKDTRQKIEVKAWVFWFYVNTIGIIFVFFLDWIFWWNVRPQPKRSEAIIQVRQISWYIFKIFWKAFESINSFECSGDGKVLALAGWLLPSLGILSFRFGSRWMRLMATISVLDTVKITVN